MSDERNLCPECGKRMIRRELGGMVMVMPPNHTYRWWCAVHGYQGEIEQERELTLDELALQQWKALNSD